MLLFLSVGSPDPLLVEHQRHRQAGLASPHDPDWNTFLCRQLIVSLVLTGARIRYTRIIV